MMGKRLMYWAWTALLTIGCFWMVLEIMERYG